VTGLDGSTSADEPLAGARAETGLGDEAEELTDALLWAIHLADTEADPPDWPTVEAAPAICPPHHWLILDHPDPALLTLRCVRCDLSREQPRDPQPIWRPRGATRARSNTPEPPFG